MDLGIIDGNGNQKTYVGPYPLGGKNYRDQEWFRQVVRQGHYISDVFLGYRQSPHLVIAVKHLFPDGTFQVLRATLDTERFNHLLTELEVSGSGDAFLINAAGVLQTPSRLYGQVLGEMPLAVPPYSPKTEVLESHQPHGKSLVIGYAYIEDSPFILMIVKHKEELMTPWFRTRMELIGFLILSISGIVIVILGVATYLVGRIHLADQRRVAMLHSVEYASKMASIGRLAAGVAHEINNPLAIINEKAGLIKDLFLLKNQYQQDSKLLGLVDSIISSVERCSTITRRLLRFARHMEVSVEKVDLEALAREVLGFLGKEAEYRSIEVLVRVLGDVPPFETDRGKLQQILLNIINNAFAALSDGGRLEIIIKREGIERVSVTFKDNGCGIPKADLGPHLRSLFYHQGPKGWHWLRTVYYL